MAGNSFKPQKFFDVEIVDSRGNKVGDIRIKPSGILWSPKGKHQYYGVNLEDFATFMEDRGKLQDK